MSINVIIIFKYSKQK